MDLVERAAALFDRVVVAILVNSDKSPLFTQAERVAIVREVFAPVKNVDVEAFDGLLVDYADCRGAVAIVRGLRSATDTDYELSMSLMNRHLQAVGRHRVPSDRGVGGACQLTAGEGSVASRRRGRRLGAAGRRGAFARDAGDGRPGAVRSGYSHAGGTDESYFGVADAEGAGRGREAAAAGRGRRGVRRGRARLPDARSREGRRARCHRRQLHQVHARGRAPAS